MMGMALAPFARYGFSAGGQVRKDLVSRTFGVCDFTFPARASEPLYAVMELAKTESWSVTVDHVVAAFLRKTCQGWPSDEWTKGLQMEKNRSECTHWTFPMLAVYDAPRLSQ